jgi:CRP/FNR family transcriptional regulator, cyclic AMP receptor protein
MSKSSRHISCENNEFLAEFQLFAELSKEELQTLVNQSTVDTFTAGQRIMSVGEPGHCMYVILAGKARVSFRDRVLATLAPGDFFGEVALVDDGPRSADVTALEDCELLCITRTTLGVLAGLQPGAAIHLLAAIGRCLVTRLRACNQKHLEILRLNDERTA